MLAMEIVGLERLMHCCWGGVVGVSFFGGGLLARHCQTGFAWCAIKCGRMFGLGYRLQASTAHEKMARQGLDL